MTSITLYFKDSSRELTINDVLRIITPQGQANPEFDFVSERGVSSLPKNYLFFEDNKNYIIEGKNHNVFVRGSAILCASSVTD